jgi:NADH dehydrogenase
VPELNVVTGGLSYIGKYITKRLVSEGKQVLVLTGHPNRSNPFGNQITIAPWNFDNEAALVKSLQGVTTLYNTYWVRFDHGQVSFNRTIENTKVLIKAAEEAGISKIVHLSVSNPSEQSPFPYFRGKAVLEKAISQSKLSYAIIRPTLVFGGEEEILVNNIAWLLRRFPVYAIPKPGSYRLQPIHVDEVADLAVNAAQNVHNKIIDAAGPDILTFEEMVRLIARKIGSRSLIFSLSPELSLFLLKIVGLMVYDVVLTRDELGALMGELLVSQNPPAGKMRMADWLDRNAASLGRRYASEFDRHYR